MGKRAIHSVQQNSVVNHTNFGRSIKNVAQKNLMDLLEEKGHGWSDGGCFTFAHGIHSWINSTHPNLSQLVSVISPGKTDQTDHVLCKIQLPEGNLFIDSDGCGTEKEILYRWDLLEHHHWQEPCTISTSLANTDEIEGIYHNFSEQIKKAFENDLGGFSISLLQDIPTRIMEQNKNPREFPNIKGENPWVKMK